MSDTAVDRDLFGDEVVPEPIRKSSGGPYLRHLATLDRRFVSLRQLTGEEAGEKAWEVQNGYRDAATGRQIEPNPGRLNSRQEAVWLLIEGTLTAAVMDIDTGESRVANAPITTDSKEGTHA